MWANFQKGRSFTFFPQISSLNGIEIKGKSLYILDSFTVISQTKFLLKIILNIPLPLPTLRLFYGGFGFIGKMLALQSYGTAAGKGLTGVRYKENVIWSILWVYIGGRAGRYSKFYFMLQIFLERFYQFCHEITSLNRLTDG